MVSNIPRPDCPPGRAHRGIRCAVTLVSLLQLPGCGLPNTVSIRNITYRIVDAESIQIGFDVSWPHSFRNGQNRDALWTFAKYRYGDRPWQPISLRTDAAEHQIGADNGVAGVIDPSRDGFGAFLYRAGDGLGVTDWNRVVLTGQFDLAEPSPDSSLQVRVFGLPMVFVPGGPFWVGDGEIGNVRGHFQSGPSGQPVRIDAAVPLSLGRDTLGSLGNSGGYGMVLLDDFSSLRRTLPSTFPTGIRAFYLMRYELTQRQYADFLATLDDRQLHARFPGFPARPRTVPGVDRYGISSAAPFLVSNPAIPVFGLSWRDAAAYADWAGLRPYTELEFEKAARGDRAPAPGEFAWGTPNIADRHYSLVDENTPSERVDHLTDDAGNALYARTAGTDTLRFAGDGLPRVRRRCWSCIHGPVAVDAFLVDTVSERTGASASGALHLSGNLFERVVTIGNGSGRRFQDSPGDGHLGPSGDASGPEVATWPGQGGTAASLEGTRGLGLRGGSWMSPAFQLRVSDRTLANVTDTTANPLYGYRFARSAMPPAPVQGGPGQVSPDTVLDSTAGSISR